MNGAHAAPGDKNPPTAYVPTAEKGVASGVATLNIDAKIPLAQLPDLSATYAIKPDNGAKAVGKGELVINVKDYGVIGNGVADDSAAINALLATTRDLYFPQGTYMVSNLIVSLADARLKGDNGAILKKRANGELLEIAPTATGAVIDGLTLDGNSPFTGVCLRNRAVGVTVQFCYAKNAISGDATIHGSQGQSANMTVRYCTIEGTARAENADNFTVDHCNILPTAFAGQASGLGVWAVTAVDQHADNARFTNNYIEVSANGFAIVPLSRNGAIPPRNVLVSGNTVITKQNCYGGFSVDSCGSGVVSNNTFHIVSGVPSAGAVEVVKSSNIVVTGNHFNSAGVMLSSIVLNNSSGCVVTGNTLSDVITRGIWINSPLAGNKTDRNIVHGNSISIAVAAATATNAIAVTTNNATTTADNNTISGNTITGNGGASHRGFLADAVSGSVAGTVVESNSFISLDTAIRLYRDTASTIRGNKLTTVTNPVVMGASPAATGAVIDANSWQYVTAAPTTGYHVTGERAINSAPAVASPTGWVCTATGTPGTWVALANL